MVLYIENWYHRRFPMVLQWYTVENSVWTFFKHFSNLVPIFILQPFHLYTRIHLSKYCETLSSASLIPKLDAASRHWRQRRMKWEGEFFSNRSQWEVLTISAFKRDLGPWRGNTVMRCLHYACWERLDVVGTIFLQEFLTIPITWTTLMWSVFVRNSRDLDAHAKGKTWDQFA